MYGTVSAGPVLKVYFLLEWGRRVALAKAVIDVGRMSM